MKQNTKRFILLLLAASLVFSMAACGRGGGGDNGGADQNEGPTLQEEGLVYVPAFITTDILEEMGPSVIAISGDLLYVRYTVPGTWAVGIGTLRRDGTGFTSIWEGSPRTDWEEDGVNHFSSEDVRVAGRPGGGLVVLRQEMGGFFDNDTFESEFWESYYLMSISSNGTVEREVNISELINLQDQWMNQMHVLSDGRVLLSTWDTIFVLSAEFAPIRQVEEQDGQGFFVLGDDQVLLMGGGWDEETQEFVNTLHFLDLDTGQLRESDIALPANFHNIVPGQEYDAYVATSRSVYGFDLETEQSTLLFNWRDMDILNPTPFAVSDTGEVYFFESRWDGTPGARTSLIRLSKQSLSDIPEQIELTLGGLFVRHDVQQQVVEFNRRNPQYRIQIVEYWDFMSGEDFSAALQRFHADLLAGNIPDILELSPETPFDLYARRGFLADIGAHLDADSQLSRSDLVESVARLLEVDGTLYTVVPHFSIQTLSGRQDRVGPEMGWTMAEFLRIVDDLPPETTAFEPRLTREVFLEQMLGMNLGLFIDRETGVTNFDSPLFMDYLTFAQTLMTNEELWNQDDWGPGDMIRPLPVRLGSYSGGSAVSLLASRSPIAPAPPIGEIEEWESPFGTGAVLLMDRSLWSFQDLVFMEDEFRGNVAFKGYPSETGTGSMAAPSTILAMSANSSHPDVAWTFLRTFLAEDYQWESRHFGFSMNRNILARQMEDAMAEVEQEEFFFLPPVATQAQVDQILALIQSLDQLAMRDEVVLDIILEETLPYFEGNRNLQETVRIIQSRVQTIVSERR